MSYLLFDAAYTRALIDIGYRDASGRIAEIEEFIRLGAAAGGEAELEVASCRCSCVASPGRGFLA